MKSGSRSEANAWLAHLVGSASEHAVVFLDPRGSVVAWLGAAERIFGYGKAEALELEFADLFTPDDRRLQMDLQELAVARTMGRSEDERWHVRKDGSLFWASGVVAVVKNPDGEIEAFCKVLRDRTDLRQQLDTLQNRVRALQQEGERKSRLLESLGHQLRALLGPLEDATKIPATGQTPSVQSRQLAARVRQVAAMSSVLEDVTRAPVAEPSGRQQRMETIVLQEVLKECVNSALSTGLAGGQHVHLSLPQVALRVDAEPASLHKMLHGLLANALKNTQSGGNIYVTASVEADSAIVRVTDDGVGITGRRFERLFALLTGAESRATVRDSEAALAGVKDLATKLGGSLVARSSGNGKGSVLALRLPLALK